MKSFAAAAAAALIALVPSVIGLTVNTPQGVTECEPFEFTWTGGTPPYFLSLIPGATRFYPHILQRPIKQFPPIQGTSYTWLVDLQANTNFIASLKDDTGTQAFAALATINAGTDSSAASATPTGAASSHSGGSSASGTASGSSPSKTSNAGSVASSASTFGIAGLFGLVGAALF
ncbi:hypothetical protein PILCRDRAFT_67223 [Piloderma croceum F 1598]|uniref:Uncharacterized protein n=1 Tax=Piloderma croceum (strain F 1598) TaxID=765440 RepID=A0A0C3FLS3_PILCF|nr:hypothetical protein PILCRDRAFT_67223 [Piloderma croceum F 1598]